MVGIEGNLGILGPDFIAGKGKALVIVHDNNTQEMVWEYDTLPGGPNNGADAHIPSNLKLLTSGLWRLDAYLGGKLKGSIVIDVKAQ